MVPVTLSLFLIKLYLFYVSWTKFNKNMMWWGKNTLLYVEESNTFTLPVESLLLAVYNSSAGVKKRSLPAMGGGFLQNINLLKLGDG